MKESGILFWMDQTPSRASVIRLVNEYQASIRNISIRDNLVFLRSLSDHHAESLRELISSSANSQ